MKRNLLGLFYFAVTIALLTASLKLANWLPTAVQEGLIRKYDSVEEVKSKLRVKEVYIPSYFPQSFRWPPSTILAQSRPFVAIVMEFRNIQTGDAALVISQSAGNALPQDRKIPSVQIRNSVPYQFKGRAAVLEVGKSGNDAWSRISWDEGIYRITVEMKSAPFDLLKIADSMIR